MSSGRNYIIVNSEAGSAIADAVVDLSRYIDQRNDQPDGPLTSMAQEFKRSVEAEPSAAELPAETQELFFTLAESSGALLKSPPSEFEASFNLMLYVLSSAPDFNALMPVILANITNNIPSAHAQQLALLAVLGNFFNVVSSTSPQKAFVFNKIVDLAVAAKTTVQLVPQLPQIAEWLKTWEIDNETREELVRKLVDSIPAIYSSEVMEFLKKVVTNQPELTSVTELLVTKTLSDDSTYSFEPLLVLEGVKALKSEQPALYDTLRVVAEGDYAAFGKLDKKYSDNASIVKKARVTALARLASGARELNFNDIAAGVSIPDNEVEVLVVDTVKAGLIQGRMSQLQEKFFVESATVVGPVTEYHWNTIEERLASWKKSLSSILELSEKARNNHELVKNLNKLEVN